MKSDTSMMRWDMESIFPGGSASKEFEAFRKAIVTDLEKVERTIESLPLRLEESDLSNWRNLLLAVQDLDRRLNHADSFAYCLTSQDVSDDRAMTILEEISSLDARLETVKTGIEDLAINVDGDAWNRLLDDDKLEGSVFYWNERRRIARLKMEPKMEKLATQLAVNGYHAWNRLYTRMAGDLNAEFVEDGESKTLSMGQIANKMSLPDRDIRRQAFEKLERAWESVASLAAMELNSLAGFRLSLYKARGWGSPVFEPFMLARVSQDTVDSMWKAISRSLDRMAAYVAAKKRLLGMDEFRWYDQYAPVGEVSKTIPYEDATDFVVKHLTSFSQELGDFARLAIDNRWIEAEDRSGKAAGGYCAGLPVANQSRIFMTYSGNYNEMMTLAHELGHAYHSWVFRDMAYYARHYTMTLAETASTFNELLVTDAALQETGDNSEKLSLIDRKLQDHLAMFCNIRARYLFELMFYDERKKAPVPKDRLNELMVAAQREAFGGILAEDGYHPLFWASKLHFSETSVPFYNFPYTFGHLFASGIYARAKKEGRAFAERYRDLLVDTGKMTCEDLARKHFDVDLASTEFWNEAVARALDDVDTFINLAS
jgi:pepF/M3 family oligoendopeptidase